MTDRDRLIELLEDTLHEWECDVQSETLSQIAEHLIENGVIVPPCKVGDTVYVIYNNKVTIGKVDSLDVVIEESDTSYVAGVKFFDRITMIKGFSFGLNVFLTKEEAEKALAETGQING